MAAWISSHLPTLLRVKLTDRNSTLNTRRQVVPHAVSLHLASQALAPFHKPAFQPSHSLSHQMLTHVFSFALQKYTSACTDPCLCAQSLQLCLILCDPMDCSPPGFSVHGFSRQEHWSGLPSPPPGDLPNPGIQPRSLKSSVLTDGFFTTNTAWESCPS